MALVTTTLHFRSQQDAKRVDVVGSWDDWKGRIAMHTEGNGEWNSVCRLPAGKVSFKFVCDGVWLTTDSYDVVDDGYGGVNNQMVVPMLVEREEGEEEEKEGDECVQVGGERNGMGGSQADKREDEEESQVEDGSGEEVSGVQEDVVGHTEHDKHMEEQRDDGCTVDRKEDKVADKELTQAEGKDKTNTAEDTMNGEHTIVDKVEELEGEELEGNEFDNDKVDEGYVEDDEGICDVENKVAKAKEPAGVQNGNGKEGVGVDRERRKREERSADNCTVC